MRVCRGGDWKICRRFKSMFILVDLNGVAAILWCLWNSKEINMKRMREKANFIKTNVRSKKI